MSFYKKKKKNYITLKNKISISWYFVRKSIKHSWTSFDCVLVWRSEYLKPKGRYSFYKSSIDLAEWGRHMPAILSLVSLFRLQHSNSLMTLKNIKNHLLEVFISIFLKSLIEIFTGFHKKSIFKVYFNSNWSIQFV